MADNSPESNEKGKWCVRYELEVRLNQDMSTVVVEIGCRDEARAKEIADERLTSSTCKRVRVLQRG